MSGLAAEKPSAKTSLCPCCGASIINDGRVLIDAESGIIIANGYLAALTKTEMEIFTLLWEVRPRVLSQENLLKKLYWQGSVDEEPEVKIIDVFVCKIRKQIAEMPISLETVWGRGYRIKLLGEDNVKNKY